MSKLYELFDALAEQGIQCIDDELRQISEKAKGLYNINTAEHQRRKALSWFLKSSGITHRLIPEQKMHNILQTAKNLGNDS